jgi:hypothetical protein
MKKIIALLVVFALFAGSAFAVDLGGAVNGSATLFAGSSEKDSEITSDLGLGRVRIDGGGQNDEGTFGGWLRFDPTGGNTMNSLVAGLAWWKPLDVLKVTIGANPDGHFGKEGVTGWMFSQTAYDVAVTVNSGNIWGGGMYGWNSQSRSAFTSGWDSNALMLEITPLDILAINVALPFAEGGKKLEDVFNKAFAQVDVNLAFADIALTYKGAGEKAGNFFAYVGLPLGIVNLDIGAGIPFDNSDDTLPINFGIGAKAGLSDLFGIKLRAWATVGGEKKTTAAGVTTTTKDPFILTADLNPYLTLSDNLRVFFTLGFAMASYDKKEDNKSSGEASIIGFHVNPYIEVGQEWGPKFLAGFKLSNNGKKGTDPTTNEKFALDSVTEWAVAIGIQASF